jgi:hypothetical protein
VTPAFFAPLGRSRAVTRAISTLCALCTLWLPGRHNLDHPASHQPTGAAAGVSSRDLDPDDLGDARWHEWVHKVISEAIEAGGGEDAAEAASDEPAALPRWSTEYASAEAAHRLVSEVDPDDRAGVSRHRWASEVVRRAAEAEAREGEVAIALTEVDRLLRREGAGG